MPFLANNKPVCHHGADSFIQAGEQPYFHPKCTVRLIVLWSGWGLQVNLRQQLKFPAQPPWGQMWCWCSWWSSLVGPHWAACQCCQDLINPGRFRWVRVYDDKRVISGTSLKMCFSASEDVSLPQRKCWLHGLRGIESENLIGNLKMCLQED